MLSIYEQQMIHSLYKAGRSVSVIAAQLHRSVGAVYKYIGDAKTPKQEIKDKSINQAKALKEYHDLIDHKISQGLRNSSKLFREIQSMGYMGSYAQLNAYVRENTTKKSYKPAIRVETPAGEQAQVDWGTFGEIVVNGQREKLHAFIYVLSYSRMLYIEFAIHQNQQVLQRAHINAFEKFGIPRTIRYDNMKTVVLSHKRSKENGEPIIQYNPAFIDFARYYNFEPFACPPYWPRAKGKVERMVRYVRDSFMEDMVFGKSFRTIDEINILAQDWLDTVANVRIHRTTNRRPVDLWEKERHQLKQIDNTPVYNVSPSHIRRSTKDGLVQYKYNLYAVPQELAQKKLYLYEVEQSGKQYLEVFYKNLLQVRHQISYERGKWIMGNSLNVEDHTVRAVKIKNERVEKIAGLRPVERELSYYNQFIPERR